MRRRTIPTCCSKQALSTLADAKLPRIQSGKVPYMKRCPSLISITLLLLGLLVSAVIPAQTANIKDATRSTGSEAGQPNDLAGDMAKANLAKQGISNPTPTQLELARQSVLNQRAKGMGWGQIANALGLNLGKVISASAHAGNDARKPTPPGKADKNTQSSGNQSSAQSSKSSSSAGGSGGHGGK